jgi:glycosyltransferase involved in cell wall biosynthesis
MKISIIVPAYNSEKTLKRCIDSIINQTYSNIEIIIVNDGSTDNTKEICDQYAQNDLRIKVIHKNNGGVSSARNEGIKNASGEFIQFIDSDDYIDVNMCERLVKVIKEHNSDLVVCGYKTILGDSISFEPCINKRVDEIADLSGYFSELYKKHLFNSPWNKLYKREKINFYYDENLSLGEDLLFNLEYLKRSKKISFIEDCLYNYVIGSKNSLTAKYNENLFDISLNIYDSVNDFCDNYFVGKTSRFGVDTVFIRNVFGAVQGLVYNAPASTKEKITTIKKWITNNKVQKANKTAKLDSFQYRIFSILIRIKISAFIYCFFKTKQLVYNLLKTMRCQKNK